MKTSNKLMLTAVLILLGSLAVFNTTLKAEFDKGTFRDPYNDFTSMNHKNFDKIRVNSASEMNVEIIPGDFKVYVHKNSADYVKVTQQGSELVLDIDYPEKNNSTVAGQHIIIAMPNLQRLTTDAVYTMAGETVTKSMVHDNYYVAFNAMHNLNRIIQIRDMTLDSLTLQQDKASIVELKNSRIRNLQAAVGLTEGSGSKLVLNSGNTIQKANLDIRNNSALVLENIVIPDLNMQFSKQAKTLLTGASLTALKK